MNDLFTFSMWGISLFIAIGVGLLWGYLMCLRNHKLIKGEEKMWEKKE